MSRVERPEAGELQRSPTQRCTICLAFPAERFTRFKAVFCESLSRERMYKQGGLFFSKKLIGLKCATK